MFIKERLKSTKRVQYLLQNVGFTFIDMYPYIGETLLDITNALSSDAEH